MLSGDSLGRKPHWSMALVFPESQALFRGVMLRWVLCQCLTLGGGESSTAEAASGYAGWVETL